MNPPGSNERAGRFFQRTKAVSGKKIGLERNGTHGRFLREHNDAVRLLEERHAEAVAKRERQMEHAQDWIHKIKAREVVLDSEGTQRTGVASDSEECQRSTPCSTGPPLEVGRGNSCSRKQMSRSRDFPCTDDCGNGCTCRQNGADDGRVPWTPKPASSCKTD